MEGITILNTITMPNVILGIFTIASLIGLLIGFFIYLRDDEPFGAAVMISSLIMSIICGLLFLTSEKKERYEVTIDENVKFNEFMEHYKVIEQHGQIYVIEERETDKTV
jgi:hypothetical protein